MPRILIALIGACLFATTALAQEVRGSGSTFVYPVLTKWAQAFERTGGANVVYRPIGSAAGLTEVRHEIVDFAVSEAPLDGAQLRRDGLLQFPVVIGGIVPIVNIEGVGPAQIRFTGRLLADIYFGNVTNWNDPAITAVNPDLKLPDLKILVVHRSDGSGSSFTWCDYLSKVSADWKARVGAHMNVRWPTGVGAKHSRGVTEAVGRFRGAIGYVDYGNAIRQNLAYGLVQNRAGRFIKPDLASIGAATAEVNWMRGRDFHITLTDTAAPDGYPLVAVSFAVVRKFQSKPERARDMQAFLRWSVQNGREMATTLNYLPLPASLVQEITGYLDSEVRLATVR